MGQVCGQAAETPRGGGVHSAWRPRRPHLLPREQVAARVGVDHKVLAPRRQARLALGGPEHKVAAAVERGGVEVQPHPAADLQVEHRHGAWGTGGGSR